jgi:cytidine deaminase
VAADDVAALLTEFGLRSTREAAILALPAAATLARPAISDYHVGAVGLTPGGELILGGNLEFPGASIHHTVHGEGFVTLRAGALGLALAELAIREARPCAHCRQVLAELAWADDLRIVDPLGHDLALQDIYPWPFTPADLGQARAAPRVTAPTTVRLDGSSPGDIAAALLRAGARAHAPYSREPAAVVLRLADGRLAEGAVLESVAFNPTIGPLQDALVALVATEVPFDTIGDAWLGVARDGRVDHVGPTRDLLAAVAPGAALHTTYWA